MYSQMPELAGVQPSQETRPETLSHQAIPGSSLMADIGGSSALLPLMMPMQLPSGSTAASLLPLMIPSSNYVCTTASASNMDLVSSSPTTSMPPPGAAPVRRRRFSTARIQPTRIKKVMQADEEIGRMVQSVPVAIGRAMEHFAEKFLQATAQATLATNNRTLTPAHMKQAMFNNPHFYFLEPLFRDIAIPGKVGMGLESPTDIMPPQAMNSPLIQSPVTPLTPGQFAYPMSSANMFHPLLASSLAQQLNLHGMLPPQMPSSSNENVPVTMPAVPPAEPKKAAYKRSNSGSVDSTAVTSDKPKRGRPRKIKKDEKCMDDDLCKEVTSNIEKEDKDRELMPPPALPVGLNLSRAKPFA